MNDYSGRPSHPQKTDAPLQRTHLPALVGRMLDDVLRIAEAQAKLFDANLTAALSYALDRAIGRAIAAAMCLLGGMCLLIAMIVLFHRYLQWWQALAISGVIMFAAAWIMHKVTLSWAARQDGELGQK
jgi:Putative Actinobacterial Holin-X, holin superfamily III